MTIVRRHPLPTALAVCACLGLGACGSDDEPEGEKLPAASVTALQNRLDEVERRYEDGTANANAGACNDIQTDSFSGPDGIDELVAALPEDVDPDLRTAVEDSFENLRNLAEQGCADATDTESDTVTEEAPEVTVPEVETVPEETVTEVEPPPEETTEPTEEVEPVPEEEIQPQEKVKPEKESKPGKGGGVEAPAVSRVMATPEEISGRYVLDRRLGAGGMSTVFLAMDSVLERPVAVKLLAEHLAEDDDFVARFRREALAAARLQHPNIVQVFDSGEDPGSHRHFIVMEYVDGPSCADLLRDAKELEVQQTVSIVVDACHGLEYAHRAGVVHRDVKPGNLLIAGETSATKLADFGIAKAAEQTRITQVGSVLGTAAYLSPEQARGDEAGPASDIYSLGVCAYQFLTGRLPHEYSSLTELALKQQNDQVEPITIHRPEVPAGAGPRHPGVPRA